MSHTDHRNRSDEAGAPSPVTDVRRFLQRGTRFTHADFPTRQTNIPLESVHGGSRGGGRRNDRIDAAAACVAALQGDARPVQPENSTDALALLDERRSNLAQALAASVILSLRRPDPADPTTAAGNEQAALSPDAAAQLFEPDGGAERDQQPDDPSRPPKRPRPEQRGNSPFL